LEALHASGLLAPPSKVLDLQAFLAAARPVLASGTSLGGAILDEREDGR
jgi:hypothetical protein